MKWKTIYSYKTLLTMISKWYPQKMREFQSISHIIDYLMKFITWKCNYWKIYQYLWTWQLEQCKNKLNKLWCCCSFENASLYINHLLTSLHIVASGGANRTDFCSIRISDVPNIAIGLPICTKIVYV